MSIAPPSDIILDVAQAADPQRLQAATTKLATMASSAGGPQVDFAALLAGAAAKTSGAKPPTGSTLNPPSAAVRPQMSPYRKFEAVLLQTFVQEILPKDENLFGDAASSDVCRSMLAEQLANQLAKSGKLGIAKMIEKAHGPQAAAGHGAAPGPAASPASPVEAPAGAAPSTAAPGPAPAAAQAAVPGSDLDRG